MSTNNRRRLAEHSTKQHATTTGSSRTASSTTAGKLQAFYLQHTTAPAAGSHKRTRRSRPSSPSPTAAGAHAADTANGSCSRLKTGQDVLQHHFGTRGLDATPKLVHCVAAAATSTRTHRAPAPAPAPAAALCITAQHDPNNTDAADDVACTEQQQQQRDTTQGPYDLRVVPRSQLPASYFTLSATGVVEVPGDGAPSLHTPVGQWVRHASLHELLSSLPAGQHMLKGSILNRWRANAQQQRFQQRRTQLSQQLLLLKPAFARVLHETRARLAHLAAEGPLGAMEGGMFKLEALVTTQQDYQQSKLAPLLARLVAGVVSDLEALAQRLQSNERLLRREVADYKKDPSAGATQGMCSIKIKAERSAVTAKHTTAVHDLQRLPCFLRLLAQIILQSQLDLLVSAVAGLREHLTAPGNALQVDLLLQGTGAAAAAGAGGGGSGGSSSCVHMSPSQEETLKALSKGVLEHMVSILIAAPRLLQHHSMAALLADPINCSIHNSSSSTSAANRGSMSGGSCLASCDGAAGARPSVHVGSAVVSGAALKAAAAAAAQAAAAVSLSAWLSESDGGQEGGRREGGQLLMCVVGDKSLQTNRRLLDQHVMRSYREAQQVADALGDLGVLLRFACMWDARAYKARQHSVAGLRKDALLLREWQAQLQVVLDSQCVGMLRLETGALKATYSNTLSSAQATVTMMMVVAGRRAAEGAIDRLQAVTRQLAQQPSKLPDFISFRLEVRGVRQQQEDLLVALPAQVSDLYAAVTAWGFRLPHTDQGLLEDLREACRGCAAALTAAVAFLDSRQLGMVALLDRQAKDLLRQVQEALRGVEAASLAQRLAASNNTSSSSSSHQGARGSSSGARGSSSSIDSWRQQLAQLSAAGAVINQQEEQLDMRCTHFAADLHEAQRVLQEMQHHEQQQQQQSAAVG